MMNVRHDDVQSYKLLNGRRFDPRTSGFYANSTWEAVASAYIFGETGQIIYVPGHHQHSVASSCQLPEVSKARFDALRQQARDLVWRDYHLVVKNCQHWANAVFNAAR